MDLNRFTCLTPEAEDFLSYYQPESVPERNQYGDVVLKTLDSDGNVVPDMHEVAKGIFVAKMGHQLHDPDEIEELYLSRIEHGEWHAIETHLAEQVLSPEARQFGTEEDGYLWYGLDDYIVPYLELLDKGVLSPAWLGEDKDSALKRYESMEKRISHSNAIADHFHQYWATHENTDASERDEITADNLRVGDKFRVGDPYIGTSDKGVYCKSYCEYEAFATASYGDEKNTDNVTVRDNENRLKVISKQDLVSIGTFIGNDYARQTTEDKGTYKLYQLPSGEAYRGIRYESKDSVEQQGITLGMVDYNLVYEGKFAGLTAEAVLNELYHRFNVNHPLDFKGRSMAVSDVVVIEQDGEQKAYYCDKFGFKEMPEFFDEENNGLKGIMERFFRGMGDTVETPDGEWVCCGASYDFIGQVYHNGELSCNIIGHAIEGKPNSYDIESADGNMDVVEIVKGVLEQQGAEILSAAPPQVLSMEHSKYSFVYPVNNPSDVEVYRFFGRNGEEKVTDNVMNNVLYDLFLEAINLREQIAELQKQLDAERAAHKPKKKENREME